MHLGDFLWSLLVIFFMVVYFMMLFRVIIDVFRRTDLSGWGKAGWFIALLVVPLLSLLVYVIARGNSMTQRDQAQYEQLRKAHELLASGAISQAEFDTLKAKALSS
jgi:uncharacterized membrane protein